MIIGLIGKVGSGKDTVADILDYIVFRDECAVKEATYEGWCKANTYESYLPRFAFGDNVKKVVSSLYSIPLEYLYNRDYKDNYYYCISTNEFSYKTEIHGATVIEDLNKDNINMILHSNVFFRLRQLLQFVGTDLCKNQLGSNIWIKSTFNSIYNCNNNIVIITDVRFQDEADAIIKHDSKSVLIKVVNTTKFKNNESNHASEDVNCIDDKCISNVIKWDGTVNAALFVAIKDIYYKHIKPKLK